MINYKPEDIVSYFKGADESFNPMKPSFLVVRSGKYFFRGVISLNVERESVGIAIYYGQPIERILSIDFSCSRVFLIDGELCFFWNDEFKGCVRRRDRGFLKKPIFEIEYRDR